MQADIEFLLLCCVQPTQSDALAVLADVAGSAREEMEVAGQLQVLATSNTSLLCLSCSAPLVGACHQNLHCSAPDLLWANSAAIEEKRRWCRQIPGMGSDTTCLMGCFASHGRYGKKPEIPGPKMHQQSVNHARAQAD